MEMNFAVDESKCISCGKCVADCVASSLQMVAGKPEVARFGDKTCIGCQHCLAVCPTGAVSIFGKTAEDCVAVRAPTPSHERLASLYMSRRSCRHYKKDPVALDKISSIMDVLKWSPTGHNDRGLHFTVVADTAKMDEIRAFFGRELLDGLVNDTLPPEFKWVKLRRARLERGDDIVLTGAPHMIVAATRDDSLCKEVDPIIALTQFETMAQGHGLGTTWCGLAFFVMSLFKEESRRMLQIPDGYSISYAMLFGERDVSYPRSTAQNQHSLAII